jgi:3-methyladenine DNA glycosylase AlkC
MPNGNYITPFSHLTNSSGKHKDWYSPEFVKVFCQQVNPENRYFRNDQFYKEYIANYKQLELKQRLSLMADLFNTLVDKSYTEKLAILSPLLGEKLPFEEGMFTHCYHLYPVSQFIEIHGITSIKKSLGFIEKLTMRFTGEWAIRPLANYEPQLVLKQMKSWSKHENFHVRRLASEGLRARLPWGKKIDWVNHNPKLTLPIYNKLRNDPVLYVRRSVANSMGDLIKLDPDLAMETFDKWLKKKRTPENLWVIKHAIRNPVKKKIQNFLELKLRLEKLKS